MFFSQEYVKSNSMDLMEAIYQQINYTPEIGEIFVDFEGNDFWIVGEDNMMIFANKVLMALLPTQRTWHDIVLDYGPMIRKNKVDTYIERS